MRKSLLTLAASGFAAASAFAGFTTSEPSYIVAPVSGDYEFTPIVTVGDYVPATGAPGSLFTLTGLPDAMGIYKDPVSQENILFVAHEHGGSALTTPIFGGTALKGAYVSRFVLDYTGGVVSVASANIAHGELLNETTFVAATPPSAGAAFTRFCSGSFAGPAHGMDRPMFLTNEESASGTYDAAGAQTVAIIDGKMHMLPDLGRIARETTLVMPRRDAITAIVSTEDEGTPSYVYLYVGTKQRRSSDVLAKNGLVDGKIYVLGGRGPDAGKDESSFTTGTAQMRWIEIPGAAALTAAQLATQAGALGAFGMVRVEDTEFDPLAPTRSLFVASTGGSGVNRLGRLYKVNFDPRNPAGNATMDVIYNADLIITPGGSYSGALVGGGYSGGDINAGVDFPVSVDNIAVTGDVIVIQEDRNSPADAVFTKYARNGGLWTLDRNNNYAAKYQGDFNYAYTNTRDGTTRTAGLWESSGVIDASALFGPGSFIVNVQAHGASPSRDRSNVAIPTGGTYTQAQANTLFGEDGQVLLMKLKP
jgi:hypothetical protein